ncbi:MAG TPA: acetyl-CoA carboxylase carboxyltransferase subunit beta [Verrucomicrobiae bacterium]|nr:acetyl-CoA carboxylase carboxyltransferase subunit beta [Verrucomicrobiae bacterium]
MASMVSRPHPITGAAAAPRVAWICPACHAGHPITTVREHLYVCPGCDHHTRIGARERVAQLADQDSFREWDAELAGHDRLEFTDTRPYRDRLLEAQTLHQLPDALLSGAARIGGHAVGLAAFDFGFMGGSLSAAVGERLARAAERCAAAPMPFVCVTTSGGARMQEGVFSLLQMAKSVAALHTLAESHMPFISVLADPTMGGSIASFAALGDVIVAEPRATIGFTGARVIAQVTHEELPAGFQTSEFHHARGLIDMVVDRRQLRERVIGLLRVLATSPGAAGTVVSAA